MKPLIEPDEVLLVITTSPGSGMTIARCNGKKATTTGNPEWAVQRVAQKAVDGLVEFGVLAPGTLIQLHQVQKIDGSLYHVKTGPQLPPKKP